MTLVRIDKSWSSPDLLRQTPGNSGRWSGVQFTLDPVPSPDYLIVLNHHTRPTTLKIAPERIWCFIQEPPEPHYQWLEKNFSHYARIHTQDTNHDDPKFVHTHGSLPWHINRTYDQLTAETTPPAKTRDLAWITSNLAITDGHRRRLAFLKRLQDAQIPLDLYGRGFHPIADKADALAPSRYALAIENTSAPHYWTEKIADCFLTWTMPIYHGASNLAEYFPKNSFVQIDINAPDAPQRVAEIINSDLAERNRDAIAEARRRVLEEHNLFPRLARLIAKDLLTPTSAPRTLTIPALPDLTKYYLTHNPLHRALRSLRRRVAASGLMKNAE